jgi:hypothetical protein
MFDVFTSHHRLFAGSLAVVLALSTFAAESAVALDFWGRDSSDYPYPDERETQATRDTFAAASLILFVGIGLAAAPTLIANGGGTSERRLAAASGICCAGTVGVWLAIALTGCAGEERRHRSDSPAPPVLGPGANP